MTDKSQHNIQVLADLMDTISERASDDENSSYTAKLLAQGKETCAKKFGEEAFEIALACIIGDKKHIANEAGDVLYHMLVLLKACDVELKEVMSVLANRTSQSGLQEKASRTKN